MTMSATAFEATGVTVSDKTAENMLLRIPLQERQHERLIVEATDCVEVQTYENI